MTKAVGGTKEHFEVPLVTDPYRVNAKPPAKRVDALFWGGAERAESLRLTAGVSRRQMARRWAAQLLIGLRPTGHFFDVGTEILRNHKGMNFNFF